MAIAAIINLPHFHPDTINHRPHPSPLPLGFPPPSPLPRTRGGRGAAQSHRPPPSPVVPAPPRVPRPSAPARMPHFCGRGGRGRGVAVGRRVRPVACARGPLPPCSVLRAPISPRAPPLSSLPPPLPAQCPAPLSPAPCPPRPPRPLPWRRWGGGCGVFSPPPPRALCGRFVGSARQRSIGCGNLRADLGCRVLPYRTRGATWCRLSRPSLISRVRRGGH